MTLAVASPALTPPHLSTSEQKTDFNSGISFLPAQSASFGKHLTQLKPTGTFGSLSRVIVLVGDMA